MKKTPYLRLDLEFSQGQADDFTEICWELGTVGIEESLDRLSLAAFFDISRTAIQLRRAFELCCRERRLECESMRIRKIEYDPQEWLTRYRSGFRSFAVTEGVFVHPSWEDPSPTHRVNILLDPGHAFGTGTHESTRLSLRALEELMPELGSLLEVGTGSGILSIAAAKLSPGSRIFACDIDPEAVWAARENIRSNHVSGINLFVGSTDAVRGHFDLVLGNLTLHILSTIGHEIVSLAERIVAAGITEDQCGVLVTKLQTLAPMEVAGKWSLNGWVALLLKFVPLNSELGVAGK